MSTSGGIVLFGGIALIVIAVVAFFVARSSRARHQSFAGTEHTSCADLASLAASVSQEAGRGSFSQQSEIAGKAQPAETGPLTAPISGQPCVWYRATITHRSWRNVTTGSGDTRRTERQEENDVVSDEHSESPLLVGDGTGTVLVDPREADIDRPEVSFDRFEPHTGGDGGGDSIQAFGITVNLGGSDGGSLGFHRHEEIIREGTPLYVLGEARDAGGRLELRKPGKGRFVISSRTEEELTKSAGQTTSIATAVAAVAAAAGFVLIVLGLI